MNTVGLLTMTMRLPVRLEDKGKYYITSCPILDVCSQGETENKALDNLKDAIRLFLISCFERRVLDEVLVECGFQPVAEDGEAEEPIFLEGFESITVPLPFTIHQQATSRWHV